MTKTVVLVDDDQDDLDIMKEAIAAVDPTIPCICYMSAIDAVRALSNEATSKPDFVFTDINMPGMNGERLVEELRKQPAFGRTVITVLSTTMPDHMRARLSSMGANFTFQKPVHIKDYHTLLKNILSGEKRGMPLFPVK